MGSSSNGHDDSVHTLHASAPWGKNIHKHGRILRGIYSNNNNNNNSLDPLVLISHPDAYDDDDDDDDIVSSNYTMTSSSVPFNWEETPGKPRATPHHHHHHHDFAQSSIHTNNDDDDDDDDDEDDSSSIDPREPMLPKDSNMVESMINNTRRHMSLRLPPMLEFNNHLNQAHHLRYTPARSRIRAARFNHNENECINDGDGDGDGSRDKHTLVEGSPFGKLVHKPKVSQNSSVTLGDAFMDIHGVCLQEEEEEEECVQYDDDDDRILSLLDAPPSPWILGFSPNMSVDVKSHNNKVKRTHLVSKTGGQSLLNSKARMRIVLIGLMKWKKSMTTLLVRSRRTKHSYNSRGQAEMWSPTLATYFYNQHKSERVIQESLSTTPPTPPATLTSRLAINAPPSISASSVYPIDHSGEHSFENANLTESPNVCHVVNYHERCAISCQNDTPSSSLVPIETLFSLTSEPSEHKCENATSLSSASPFQDEHTKHENRSESSIGFGSVKNMCAPCWHVDPERDLDQSVVATSPYYCLGDEPKLENVKTKSKNTKNKSKNGDPKVPSATRDVVLARNNKQHKVKDMVMPSWNKKHKIKDNIHIVVTTIKLALHLHQRITTPKITLQAKQSCFT